MFSLLLATEDLQHSAVVALLCPRAWRCPGFGCGLDRIGASIEQELHQLDASPAAGPPERRAFQQVVADVEPRAGVEQRGRKGDPLGRRQCPSRATLCRIVKPN